MTWASDNTWMVIHSIFVAMLVLSWMYLPA